MHRSLSEILERHRHQLRFRRYVQDNDFVQTTTLADVIADPKGTHALLKGIPRVGDVSIAHLKQAIFTELAELVPSEWAASEQLYVPADGTPALDIALVEQLRLFRRIWGLSAQNVTVTTLFHIDYTDPDNAVFTAALMANSPFVYAPESLPEIVKTPAVLRAEQGGSEQNEAYFSRLRSALAEGIDVPDGSLLVLDRHRLDELVNRHGLFTVLQPTDVAEQLAVLSDVLTRTPGLRAVVADFRPHRLSSGFATQGGPLFHYCFGGYLQINHIWMVRHFHATANRAADAGVSFLDWLS